MPMKREACLDESVQIWYPDSERQEGAKPRNDVHPCEHASGGVWRVCPFLKTA